MFYPKTLLSDWRIDSRRVLYGERAKMIKHLLGQKLFEASRIVAAMLIKLANLPITIEECNMDTNLAGRPPSIWWTKT